MLNDKSAHVAFARGLYPVGAALVLFPLSDIVSRMIPSNFGTLQWRFAALGLSMSSLSVLIIGVTLLGVVAAIRGNRGLLRTLSIFSWVIAAALVGSLVLFSLDTLQMRGSVQPAAKPQLAKMALSAAVAGTLHLIAFVGLGIAAWRATRRSAATEAATASPESPVLVYSGATK